MMTLMVFGYQIRRVLKEVGEKPEDERPRNYSYSDTGDETVRVVHNTLYETLG